MMLHVYLRIEGKAGMGSARCITLILRPPYSCINTGGKGSSSSSTLVTNLYLYIVSCSAHQLRFLCLFCDRAKSISVFPRPGHYGGHSRIFSRVRFFSWAPPAG